MENLINNLNIYLSDLNVFYRKLQNYHWNIKGKSFFVVHAKLEEYYNEINEQIDEVAEHILAIGGVPLATLKDYLNTTKITEAKNEKVTCEVVFNEINTLPGFTAISMYPMLWEAKGIGKPQLVEKLIQSALVRFEG